MKNLKKAYENIGFFIKKNFFNKNQIKEIIKEINFLEENVDIYYDKKGNLRRIERLYNKGTNLNSTNEKILVFLKETFDFEFTIFKDKFNAKPPGGEGFFAHYDGIFKFTDVKNENKNGWYEYSDFFVNVLIALDPCNSNNGTIEISSSQKEPFDRLFENTKKNGTPDLLPEIEKKLKFEMINLDAGDAVVFSNTCPHRSKKNRSNLNRKLLYYTYTPLKYGSMYEKYFSDKVESKNKTSKSLGGES